MALELAFTAADLAFSPSMFRDELSSRRQRQLTAPPPNAAPVESAVSPAAPLAVTDGVALSESAPNGHGVCAQQAPVAAADDESQSSHNESVVTDAAASQASAPGPVSLPAPEMLLNPVVGDLIHVAERPGKGRNKLWGPGKIVSASADGETFEVKFSLSGRDKCVPRTAISAFDQSGDQALLEQAQRESLSLMDDSQQQQQQQQEQQQEQQGQATRLQRHGTSASSAEATGASEFVRRSYRCNGRMQLSAPRVQDLLHRLRRSDAADVGLKILRVKNHLDADPSKHVLLEVLRALESNTVVQALYVQNLEEAMDDESLARLADVLRVNKRIWALNVGENFKVSREGWERFAESLRDTHVTHMYAGSETTVFGALKVAMRETIRLNRSKHGMHRDRANLDVISRIGQMWWNPSNARSLLPHLSEEAQREAASRVAPLVGRKLSIDHGGRWRLARIVKFNEARKAHLLAWLDEKPNAPLLQRGAWVRLAETEHLMSAGVAWALRDAEDALTQSVREGKRGGKRKGSRGSGSADKRVRRDRDAPPRARTLGEVCFPLWTALTRLPACKDFLRPADWERESPARASAVPMDLLTVRRRLNARDYRDVRAFAADVVLAFDNCVRFHAGQPEDAARPLARWATELKASFEESVAQALAEHGNLQHVPQLAQKPVQKSTPEAPPAPTRYWEPVQVFEHSALSPHDLRAQEEAGERMCLFFSAPRTWWWYAPGERRPWRGLKGEDAKPPQPSRLSAAQGEEADVEECIFRASTGASCA